MEYYHVLSNFNSIKVRLKPTASAVKELNHAHFNSIKVRLKQAIFIKISYLLRFQFHKGTIKTIAVSEL